MEQSERGPGRVRNRSCPDLRRGAASTLGCPPAARPHDGLAPTNLRHKIAGDHRDQRDALREAGFGDEAEAAGWAAGLLRGSDAHGDSAEGVRRIRATRPDLTLRTARYIGQQVEARPGRDDD